jgi:hypothetical protein
MRHLLRVLGGSPWLPSVATPDTDVSGSVISKLEHLVIPFLTMEDSEGIEKRFRLRKRFFPEFHERHFDR